MIRTSKRCRPTPEKGRSAQTRWRAESGQGLPEFGFLALVLVFILVGVVDFGRILMIQHVITNAAREGARDAISGGWTVAQVEDEVRRYVQQAGLDAAQASITVQNVNAQTGQPTVVIVNYPVGSVILRMIGGTDTIMMTSTSRMLHE